MRILNSYTIAAVAVLLGVAAGPGWCWYKLGAVVARSVAARREVAAAEQDKLQTRRSHGWDFWTIEMENLSSELKEEMAHQQARSDEIDKRAARLEMEKQELEHARADIAAMRTEIDDRVIAIRADEAKNLRTLAQTYTNLSPPAAVAILREMNDTTVVKILSDMKPDVVGPIFEEMSHTGSGEGSLARRAAVLSEKLRLMKSGVAADGS